MVPTPCRSVLSTPSTRRIFATEHKHRHELFLGQASWKRPGLHDRRWFLSWGCSSPQEILRCHHWYSQSPAVNHWVIFGSCDYIQKYPEISRINLDFSSLSGLSNRISEDGAILVLRCLKIQSHFALWQSTSKWSSGRCHLSEAVFLQVQNDTKWYNIVSNQNSRASFTMLYISHSVYVEFALCRVWFHANQKLERATSRGVAPWKSLMAGQSKNYRGWLVSIQKPVQNNQNIGRI